MLEPTSSRSSEEPVEPTPVEPILDETMIELDYYLGLAGVTIQWRMAEQEMKFSVRHIPFPTNYAGSMYRVNELAYIAACETPYVIPFFELKVRGDILHFKAIYMKAIQVLVAGRVRVTILTDKIAESKLRNKALKGLLVLCEEKMHFNKIRTELYEEEMDRLSSDNPFKSSNRFSSLLSNTVGYSTVSKILMKESRRLSAPPLSDEEQAALESNMDRDPTWEELNGISIEESLEDLLYCWDLLQHWQIIHAVCIRSRYGHHGYPVTTGAGQAAPRSMKGGLSRSIRPGLGEIHCEDSLSSPSSFRDSSRQRDATVKSSPSFKSPMVSRSSSGLNILNPIVPGNGVGPWETVCDALQCKDNDVVSADLLREEELEDSSHVSLLVLACRRVLLMIKSEFLVDVVSRVVTNNLNAAINDLSPDTEQCSNTSDALLGVLDAIGSCAEDRMLLRLRTSPLWIPSLSDLRKARVKREGGKLVARDEGDVEITADGKLRTIPFADDYVDSDVLHGSLQRMKVQIAAPRCKILLKESTDRYVQLQGERSCTAQFMYSISVPLLQRSMRTAIIRRRYLKLRKSLICDAMNAAAATIQWWLIGCTTRAWYRIARADRRRRACIVLQRYMRGFLARCRTKKMSKSKLDNSKDLAATKLQALIRGVLARRRVAERLAAGKEEALREAQNWGILIIQKVARGYIARRTVIKSYHIRNSLSKPVLKLTEKYLKSGNLWAFLSELDMTMRRVTDQLKETEAREDNWAETFVDKVVSLRKREFDGAWNEFHDALSVNKSSNPVYEKVSHYETDPVISAAGTVNGPLLSPQKQKKIPTKENQGGNCASTSTSPGHIAVPGVLLRRAITTSVSEGLPSNFSLLSLLIPLIYVGMKQKEEYVKQSISTLAKQRDDIRHTYGMTTSKSKTNKLDIVVNTKKRVGLTVQPNRGIQKNKGKIKACRTDWVSNAASKHSDGTTSSLPVSVNSEKSTQYLRQQSLEAKYEQSLSPRQQLLVPIKLSDFLLLDIPLGMSDKIDRLLYAAALRCFVPDFFPNYTLREAYAMYRQLPNGLAKVRYEQCAYSWSQPLVNKLRMKDLSTIADLMPISKCDMYLRSVGTPLKLLDTAKDIIDILQKQDKFPLGLSHDATKVRTEKLLSQETVQVKIAPPSPISTAIGSGVVENNIQCCEHKKIGLSFAEQFLSSTVRGGSWSEMSAPVDELLLHAAFLICSNVAKVDDALKDVKLDDKIPTIHSIQYEQATKALGDGYKGHKRVTITEFDPNKDYSEMDSNCRDDQLDVFGNDKSVTLHGHDFFLSFVRYLELLGTDPDLTAEEVENEQREAIRERYRSALLLSTPFELRLKSSGVNTVSQLTRYDLSTLDLPQLYRFQIESMLSTAIAASVGVKEAENVKTGKHLPPVNNQIAFKVPLVYNNKFQRGPFDPFGVPPRVEFPTSMSADAIAKSKLKKKSMPNKRVKKKSSRNDIDAPSELPVGLWTETGGESKTLGGKAQSSSDKPKGEIVLSDSVGDSKILSDTVEKQDLSHCRSADSFLATLPPPRVARKMRDQFEHNGTFERPYKCSHRGCNEAFSRPYTLRMHEKSHMSVYKDYVKYRNDPQYVLDADKKTGKKEDLIRFEKATTLPDYVQKELEKLSFGTSKY